MTGIMSALVVEGVAAQTHKTGRFPVFTLMAAHEVVANASARTRAEPRALDIA